jgi:response regulator RpfG family c-di-GMP phosphodiesterase
MSVAPVTIEVKRAPDRFQGIPLFILRLVSLRVDLYGLNDGDHEPRLLCSRSTTIAPEKYKELESRGHRELYVLGSEMEQVSKSLRTVLKQVQKEGKLAADEQFALLQLAYSTDIERLFRKNYCDQYVDLARAIGREVVHVLGSSTVSGPALFNRIQHSGANCVHLTNVAAYLVLLARKLGVKDAGKLERIAVGGLLHEIGKLFVSQDLVNKTGRLTPQERVELEWSTSTTKGSTAPAIPWVSWETRSILGPGCSRLSTSSTA